MGIFYKTEKERLEEEIRARIEQSIREKALRVKRPVAKRRRS